ncbi:MAG: ATP-binding cassette domain-containing protein [Butyrivibrio sp.]|uniref:cell division ATP-binding protein FtsE n=1 Tax=Butyrivibrio sp. TaxID=28121 RepID=UPI001B2918D1|nr:ATP-binding cassette domain-containing protein [Butyrivibrio sp.]MBO6241277.1 ATP-binding cassette domain-containing protein [Butyrivibrio sp.]
MIRFYNITKRYMTEDGMITVHRDFSEQIEDGEFVVVTGESGSGKTTLLKLLLKEIEPDGGEIIVDGQRLSSITKAQIPYYRRGIGVVFQDFRLIPDLCVYDNLYTTIIATGGAGKDAVRKITNILTMLGIDHLHKRFPRQMSGGEQQKVCLARAIINNPKVLLVDEPTGNLDPASSIEINRLLKVINNQGTTVVMATHDQLSMGGSGVRRINLDSIQKKERKGA